MKKSKLLLITFTFAYLSTAILCIASGHPFIFAPINYGPSGLISLAMLIGFLVFCLVFITLPLLKWIRSLIFKKSNALVFYLISTLAVLQFVTMTTGYFESLTTRGVEADFLYYYKCVTNSCIYILTGNLTVVLACVLSLKDNVKQA